jgi:class 3 adenylate cyclase
MRDDVRDLLGRVSVPTMVSARPGDRVVPFEAAAALVADIPNAQLVTLPPGDHHAFDAADVLVAQILQFCERPSASSDERVLATVLFTDIVGSTEQLDMRDERSGLAVHTGARVCGMAGATEILCTRTLHDLAAGSGLVFESLGPQRLKGLPEAVDVFRLTAG